MERGWIQPRCHATLHWPAATGACSARPGATVSSRLRPAPPDQGPILAAGPLSAREREVLRHVSGLLRTAEIASELHISIHTVKTHLKHITASWQPPAAARRSAEPASSS